MYVKFMRTEKVFSSTIISSYSEVPQMWSKTKKIHNTLILRLKLKRVQFLFYSYLLRLSLSDRVEGKQV